MNWISKQALREVSLKTGWQVQAYCLMDNHCHLVLETPHANLAAGMRWFTTVKKSDRRGIRYPKGIRRKLGLHTESVPSESDNCDDCPQTARQKAKSWENRRVKQSIVTLDLEGVLVPEIWIAVSEKTGIEELRLTTRDIPDYDVLMKGRLEILDKHHLKLSDIQEVIGCLRPLDGAKEFLGDLRATTQVIILSDTFEEFAQPLMRQLEWPTLLCHRLEVSDGRITNYRLRQSNQKQKAVAALKSLDYRVIAAGDSFNDIAMLTEAHAGFLFRAPVAIQTQFAQFKAVETYADLSRLIKEWL